MVNLLLRKGADMNSRTKHGNTAFMRASIKGHLDIVRLLLDNDGVDVNYQNNFGSTALMYASEKGHTDVVEFLLQKGATVDCRNKYGYTAFMKASNGYHFEIVKLINRSVESKEKPDDTLGITVHNTANHHRIDKVNTHTPMEYF